MGGGGGGREVLGRFCLVGFVVFLFVGGLFLFNYATVFMSFNVATISFLG